MMKETADGSGVRPSSVAATTEHPPRRTNPGTAEPLDVAATWTVALRSIIRKLQPGLSTGADKVAIAKDIVNAPNCWPEFVVVEPLGGEGGLFAGVRVVPILSGKHVGSVGGIFQHVILLVGLAGFNGLDLGVDRNQRFA